MTKISKVEEIIKAVYLFPIIFRRSYTVKKMLNFFLYLVHCFQFLSGKLLFNVIYMTHSKNYQKMPLSQNSTVEGESEHTYYRVQLQCNTGVSNALYSPLDASL